MAITTDRTITVHGVSVGISKPIQTLIASGDFTYAELSKFAFVGRHDFVNDACAVYDNANNEYGQSSQLLALDKYPILNDPTKPWNTIWYQYHGSAGRTAATYGKMILVYDFRSSDATIKNNYQDNNTACIVTELNPRLLKMKPNVTLSTITASLGEPGTYTTYDVETTINISWFDDDSASPFRPLCVSEIDSRDYFYFPLYNNTLHARQNIAGNTDGTYAQLIDLQDSFSNSGDAFLSPWASSSPILDFCPGHDYGTTFIGAYKLNTSRADRLLILDYHGAWDFNGNLQVKASSLDAALKQCAACGLYFEVNGITYKPLSSGGIVTGYTTELDKNGEWDLINDVTGNTIPDTPGGGGGGDDDDPSDDQSWGGAYSGAGAFSKFYLCTSTDLANLRTWFGGGGSGDQIPDGFDPMGQVLGLLQYPVSIAGTALSPDEITFRSGKTILHTGVSADRSTGGFLHLDCGSVDIPRRMQERGVPFLDFETSLEIYVPFCGTAPLDVQTCIGKTLTCDMYVATATGDVSAVIAAGGHPVAYMSGNMAESLPISSAGYGMYLAACKSTWGNGVSQVMNQLTGGTTDTMKNVNQAALNETLSYSQTGGWGRSELLAESYNNPRVGSAMAAAAGPGGAAAIGLIKTGLNVINAASTGYEQYKRVKNASYTSVSGSFTSCAAWNYPFTPYVKITRPHKQIPDNYKHTTAIPLVETKTLSGAPGLTTCVNPDVSGIANATAQEKDIIYRALVNGVIV